MEILLLNTSSGLKPLYDSDYEEKKKLKIGSVYKAKITVPRNYEFLKKFMALVKLGHENTSLEMPFDTYRKYLITKAGYFKAYQTPKGVFFEADSISFGSMDDIKFAEVYGRVIDVVIKDIGSTTEEIEAQLIKFF